MHVAVSEFARHVVGLEGANSTEMDPETPVPGDRPAPRAEGDRGPRRHDAPRRAGGRAGGGNARPRALRRGDDPRASPAPLRGQQPVPRAARRRTGLVVSGTFQEGRLVEIVELPITRGSSRASSTPSSSRGRPGRRRSSASSSAPHSSARALPGPSPSRPQAPSGWRHPTSSRSSSSSRRCRARRARSGRSPTACSPTSRALGLEVDEDDAGARIGSTMGNILCRLPGRVAAGTPIFLCAHLDTVPPTAAIEPVVDDGVVRNAGGDDPRRRQQGRGRRHARGGAADRRGEPPARRHRAAVHAEGGGRAARRLRVRPARLEARSATSTTRRRRSARSSSARRARSRWRCASTVAPPTRACSRRRAARRSPRPPGRSPTCGSAGRRGDDRERRRDHGRHGRQHRPRVVHVPGRGALARRAQARRPRAGDARRVRLRRERSPTARSRREVVEQYRGYRFGLDEPAVRLAAAALRGVGIEPTTALSGGAADANVFNERGLRCVNLANGMADIHTPDEHIAVADLERDGRGDARARREARRALHLAEPARCR